MGTARQLFGSAYEETRDPLVSDDDTAGFKIGNRWLNTTTSHVWECLSASTGAARWVMTAPRLLADYTKVTTKSTTYTMVGHFIFGGTSNWGHPTQILALCGIEDATSLDVRIYDVDNSAVIAELTGVTGSYPTVVDLGSPSNMPTGQAVWELQVRRNAGSGNQQISGSGCSVVF